MLCNYYVTTGSSGSQIAYPHYFKPFLCWLPLDQVLRSSPPSNTPTYLGKMTLWAHLAVFVRYEFLSSELLNIRISSHVSLTISNNWKKIVSILVIKRVNFNLMTAFFHFLYCWFLHVWRGSSCRVSVTLVWMFSYSLDSSEHAALHQRALKEISGHHLKGKEVI